MFSCHSESASHESSQLQGFHSLCVLTRAIHSFDCPWAQLCLCDWLAKLQDTRNDWLCVCVTFLLHAYERLKIINSFLVILFRNLECGALIQHQQTVSYLLWTECSESKQGTAVAASSTESASDLWTLPYLSPLRPCGFCSFGSGWKADAVFKPASLHYWLKWSKLIGKILLFSPSERADSQGTDFCSYVFEWVIYCVMAHAHVQWLDSIIRANGNIEADPIKRLWHNTTWQLLHRQTLCTHT